MSQYYIEIGGGSTLFVLDSTDGMTYTLAGKTTDFQLEDGSTGSDHYVVLPEVVNLSGSITDVVTLTTAETHKSTDDWVRELRRVQRSGTPFSVIIGSKLQKIPNCVFNSLRISQTEEAGSRVAGDIVVSSYMISCSFKQIRFGEAAQVVRVPNPTVGEDLNGREQSPETTEKVEDDTLLFELINTSFTRLGTGV